MITPNEAAPDVGRDLGGATSQAIDAVGEPIPARAVWDTGFSIRRPRARTFTLQRHRDVTGVSGTGLVAEGIVFGDGSVVLRWRSPHPTTTLVDSIDDVVRIHGNGGTSRVEFDEPNDRQGGAK